MEVAACKARRADRCDTRSFRPGPHLVGASGTSCTPTMPPGALTVSLAAVEIADALLGRLAFCGLCPGSKAAVEADCNSDSRVGPWHSCEHDSASALSRAIRRPLHSAWSRRALARKSASSAFRAAQSSSLAWRSAMVSQSSTRNECSSHSRLEQRLSSRRRLVASACALASEAASCSQSARAWLCTSSSSLCLPSRSWRKAICSLQTAASSPLSRSPCCRSCCSSPRRASADCAASSSRD
mmetsp:Transcript_10523/g.32732  ORF Transcript_10523/g.32732 Transcript_10523/m.32732 type:complete len:241 (-) Transcript_10523:145-867(-)